MSSELSLSYIFSLDAAEPAAHIPWYVYTRWIALLKKLYANPKRRSALAALYQPSDAKQL